MDETQSEHRVLICLFGNFGTLPYKSQEVLMKYLDAPISKFELEIEETPKWTFASENYDKNS